MAAPSYAEDLTDVDLAETTTGWSAYGGGASGLSASPDLAMQGTNCVDKNITGAATDKGQYYDNGAGITLGTGDHVWIWHFCATPGLTDTRANKGASVLIGTGGTAYCQYHVEGNNTYGAAGRVARCYPIDYSVRTTNASEPYRTVTGSPGANPQVFGGGLVTTATVKGANVGIDAIRYGTGAYLTAGELISAGDGSDNPCTFAGFQAQNDSSTNRWGILTAVGGGYELQGTFAIGQNNAGTATLARFQDSDVNVSIVDTIHAASSFNAIIIDHASTVCNWTNVSITALGTTSRGTVTVTANDPTFNVTGGTWTGLGAITFRGNTTVDGLTLRDTDIITPNGATMSDCVIDSCRNAVSITTAIGNVSNLSDLTFISDGSNHGIEITGTATNISLTNITFSGYDSGSTGSPVTPTSTGNEAVYVNIASGTVSIAVSGGTIPSVRSAGATVNVTQTTDVTLTGLANPTEVRVYSAGTTTELQGQENVTTGSYVISLASGTNVDIRIYSVNYLPADILNYTIPASNASLPVQQIFDRNYSNP